MLYKLFSSVMFVALPACAIAQHDSPAATTTIQVTSREVYVDVVVRDANGRVVPGLQQKDFTVKENGHVQRIDLFEEHRPPSAGVPSHPAQLPEAQAANTFSNVPPETASTTQQAGNIVLLDLLNTPQGDQLYAVKQLMKFLRGLPSGHPVALFLLTSRLEMLQGFTGSSDQLVQAAEKIQSLDLQMVRSRNDRQQMQDMIVTFAKMSSPSGGGGSGSIGSGDALAASLTADFQREDDFNLAKRAEATEVAFAQLARATAGYTGRKNVLWMADSFPFGMETQVALDRARNIPVVDNIPNLLADSRLAIYPIYLGGIEAGNVGAAANGTGEVSLMGGPGGTPTSPQAGDTIAQGFNERAALHNTMDDLARDTGGRAYYGTNDFAGALRQIVDDGSENYTLAFRTDNTKWDGRWRKISVELAQRGYTLSYRRGYYALPQSGPNQTIVQELNMALQPGTLDYTLLQLQAKLTPLAAGHNAVSVDATLNAANLIYTTDAAGHHHAQVLAELVALEDRGSEEKDRQQTNPAHTAGVLNLDLDDAQYSQLQRDGLRFREQVQIRPGKYHLRLGVAEAGTHRIGTLEMPLTVPAENTASR